MSPEFRKLREKIPDALRPVIFLLVVLTVVLGAYVAVGVETVNAEASCYNKTATCHGFRTGASGNKCLGWKVKKIDYADKNSCDTGQIKNLCGQVKKAVCKKDSGGDWMAEGIVMGNTCGEWNEVYDLGMTSCQQ